jgi:nucleoside phosphorylase
MSLSRDARKSLLEIQALFEAKAEDYPNLSHVLIEIPYPAAQSRCSPPNAGDQIGVLKADAFTRGQFIAAGNLDRADTEEVLAHIARQKGLPDDEAAAVIQTGIEAGIESAESYINSPFGKASQEAETALHSVFGKSNRLIQYLKRPPNTIQIFIDDDFQRGREAFEALRSLAETSVEILAAHKLFEPSAPPPSDSEPLWFEANKNHYAAQWMLFIHENVRKRPHALPRSIPASFLENYRLTQGGVASTLMPGVFKASSLVIERILSEMAEHECQAPVREGVERAPDRSPTISQLVEVHGALWVFLLQSRYPDEDDFRRRFIHLADALGKVRPLIEHMEGWPTKIRRALLATVKAFDATAVLWGWERLAAPEPERSRFLSEQRAWVLENVGRPMYQAAVSWQAGCPPMKCPPEVDDIADEGRLLKFKPTMSPEQGKDRYPAARAIWNRAPRLGSGHPKIGDAEQSELEDAWQTLHGHLQGVAPRETAFPPWREQPALQPQAAARPVEASVARDNQSPGFARVLIVVVTDIEFQAVMRAAREAGMRKDRLRYEGDHTYFELGLHGGCELTLVRCEMGSGGPAGSLATLFDAITAVKPVAIIMVGMAFGAKSDKQQIGDVMISRQVSAYEPQRVSEDEAGRVSRWNRGDRVHASVRLLDRFRSGAHDWSSAQVHFGLVLSGDKLVDSPSLKKELLGMEPEAIGGEMEVAGLYAAASKRKVDWIMVKGIADWGESKGDKDQAAAAKNAVDLVFHVISKGGLAV